MKKHILTLSMITLINLGQTRAADRDTENPHPQKSIVKQYVKDHITPVILQKRQALERELSDAERAEITQCRASLADLRAQHHVFMQEKPKGMDMHEYIEQHSTDKRADIRPQTKAIMERIGVIAKNHSNTLDDIKADLLPQTKQWKEDIAKLEPQRQDDHGQWHNHHFDMYMWHGLNGKFAQDHFLLMSVTSSATADNGELKSEMISSDELPATASLSAFQIGPNPATNELITGSAELPAQSEMTVYDMQGKAVMSTANVQAMQHIDVSQLASGAYIVRLQNGDQTETRKIVVSR